MLHRKAPSLNARSCNYATQLCVRETTNEETTMRTLGKIAAMLGVIGVIAASSTVPAAARYGYHHHYYHHRHYGYHRRHYHHHYAYYPRHYHHRHWYRY